MGISAKIVAHSKAPNGEELITMEVEFHRFILAEVNTHRVLSRNYQSSRAVPVEKMIEQVKTDPAIPVHWGKNQRGMVAEKELQGWEKDYAEVYWKVAARDAAETANYMNEMGVHKQVINRILEPFIWTKGVITATKEGWESMFKLRLHKDAQPEFQSLAKAMKEAIDNSVPEELNYGDYHLPYVTVRIDPKTNKQVFRSGSQYLSVEEAIKVSSSCCAQVSYRVLDDSLEKAKKIYGMLNLPVNGVYPEDPPHFSPAEHVAKVVDETLIVVKEWDGHNEFYQDGSGNFSSCAFWQYRKALEIGKEQLFLEEV